MSIEQKIEIRKSKHGEMIPSINGVFVHSAYNPIREAEAFVENHLNTLRQKNNILVLGLGFAYHIDQIIYHLNNFHTQYRLVVIEPSLSMAEACQQIRPQNLNKIILLAGKEIKSLFEDANFIRFLMDKPGVIAHSTSFNMNSEYFSKLLSYEADQSIRAFAERMPASLIPYFNQFSPESNLSDILKNFEIKTSLNHSADYLLGAISTWTQTQNLETNNEKTTHC
jgi:hypothetical protein